MGQTTSRSRRPQRQQSTPPHSLDTVLEASPSDRVPEGRETPERPPKQHRRSTFRRSVLNLVKPSRSSQPTTIGNADARPTSWRHSRRLENITSSVSAAGPSSSSPERAEDVVDRASNPPPVVEQVEPQRLEQQAESVRLNLEPSTDVDQVIISPDEFSSGRPISERSVPHHTPDVASSSSPTPATAPAPPSRQFPPPGTLVVVQGVVHTTDIPRPNSPAPEVPSSPSLASDPPSLSSFERRASSTPRPSTPHGSERSRTRNRLSVLLRSRPSSSSSSSMSNDTTSEPSSHDTSSSSTAAAPIPHDPILPEFADPIPSLPPSSPPSHDNTPAPSNSADVLGTLLSVAAAATAASLLTGSPGSMMTPSLGPDGNHPLPTHGARPPTTLLPEPGRTERMRQAWGSIRERLGIRPSASTGFSTDATSPTAPSPLEPRERMMAEMARAFNLGLGLTGEPLAAPSAPPQGTPSPQSEEVISGVQTHASPSSSPFDTAAPSSVPSQLPAEGSFERFLVDLQADLRIALSESSHSRSSTSASSDHSNSSGSGASTTTATSESTENDTQRPDPASIPLPEDLSETVDRESTTEQSPSAPPANNNRINWWRLYRFPAITVSRPQGNLDSNSPSRSSPLEESAALPNYPSAPLSTEAVSPPSTSATSPAEPSDPNVIVPVIVVGLQSVNVNWRQNAPPSTSPDQEQQQPLPRPSSPDDAEAFGIPAIPLSPSAPDPAPMNTEPTERGRRWRNVLRNLRSAGAPNNATPRRSGLPRGEGLPDFDLAGSRTFLIYVIGGYYPPDHNIITGEGNHFDSFEALLELAELLGQVKPLTVSQEDIENSGLQVIKASEVSQYESEGRISSNCVERCLICLEDYEESNKVRIMNCRHAFHQECVDKWLQTGKNNCPACRTTGIPLDTQSSA